MEALLKSVVIHLKVCSLSLFCVCPLSGAISTDHLFKPHELLAVPKKGKNTLASEILGLNIFHTESPAADLTPNRVSHFV